MVTEKLRKMAKKKIAKVKKPRKIKKYNLKSRITSALRKVWRYYPERTKVLKRCETGEHYLKISKGTGKEYKAPYYKCEECGSKEEKIQIDHIDPIVNYNGFQDWNTYIQRMFIDSEYMRGLCKSCHSGVTLVQSELRKKFKKALTKIKK